VASVSSFGDLLRQYRRELGLTQEVLAERAGLSEHGIQKLERGVTQPYRDTAQRLEDALQLAPDDRVRFRAAVRPVRRYQAARPRSPVTSPRNGLPGSRTSFVGRASVLADVKQLIRSTSHASRLLTLTGAGGTGKTRIALQAAGGMLDDFPDGVHFVDLAPVSDSQLVGASIAQTLGVSGDSRQAPLDAVKKYLLDRHLLLILDNFEQVLGAAADVAELLSACPRLQALVTSRAPLRLLGEQELSVPPLEVPEPTTCGTLALSDCESVQLFVDRARAVQPEFAPGGNTLAVVAEICRRLDGLPLAIELAAARIRLLEPRAMLGLLERRLELLTGGARDAPTRQQTLRNTIAWSYDLLEPREQDFFRRVSVFVGGCSLDAAQAVCNEGQIVDLAESLVAKNLLRPLAAGGSQSEVRIGMFETIREFGLEQLAWTGEMEPLRRRHADYFLSLAEEAEVGLRGPQVRSCLERLEREHDNLRAALAWGLAADSDQSAHIALRLAGSMARFWYMAGHNDEGRRWTARALANTPAHTPARAKALYGTAWLAHNQRDFAAARTMLEESLAIAEELDDAWARGWVLHMIGRVAYMANDPIGAQQFAEKALPVAEATGDRWLIAWIFHLMGLAAYLAGDDATAHVHYDRTVAIRRDLGDLEGLAVVLHLKGMLPHRAGDLRAAHALYREALELADEIKSTWHYLCVVPLFASLAAERQPSLAARLAGAVAVLTESAQTLPIPITEAFFNAGVRLARRKLGDTAFQAAWADGRAMPLEAAVALAREVVLKPHGDTPANLTTAEVEVLRRLARGLTTREIATELVVAVSTVDRHITHIYAKLGCRGRAAAATFAVEHGLN
jgi:non-specific serine/threonine protein kinase